jgi:prepilin-type N-terminal cleavage/methylation domain-containing protein
MRKVPAMKTQMTMTKNLPTRNGRWAFTLVELLVVIAVIALLVSIIMPSISGAKILARKARVTTTLKTISNGLEMFRSDQLLQFQGGAYPPPSFWDTAVGGNPYSASGQDSTGRSGTSIRVYGAQMLVWGLAGADLLGPPPPGFNTNTIQTYYVLDANGPHTPREGPFIDTSKATIQNPTANESIFIGSTGASASIPCIIDDFGRPILYYAATDTNIGMAKYDCNDNLPFYRTTGTTDPLANTANFQKFIHNPKITTSQQPMNDKSYLLISAGPDGLYGTRDDITNFPITGDNLP